MGAMFDAEEGEEEDMIKDALGEVIELNKKICEPRIFLFCKRLGLSGKDRACGAGGVAGCYCSFVCLWARARRRARLVGSQKLQGDGHDCRRAGGGGARGGVQDHVHGPPT